MKIVTQDRDGVLIANDVYIFLEGDTIFAENMIDDDTNFTLGVYESKKRAFEVMNDIIEFISPNFKCVESCFDDKEVLFMPKE